MEVTPEALNILLNTLTTLLPTLMGVWGQLALLSVPLCLYLATAMLPFVVICGLLFARFGRKNLYERSSRQLAGLANILNWLFLGCAGAGFLVARQELEAMHGPYLLGAYLFLGLSAGGTLLWTIVASAWKPLRKVPVLHVLIAFLSGSCIAALAVGGLFVLQLMLQGVVLPVQNEWQTLQLALLPLPLSLTDPFWLLAALLHFLEAAAAGGVGLLWLIFRRHVDDFGRDYYAFAANWCGEWGGYGGWISFILTGVILWFSWTRGILNLNNPATLLFLAGTLLPLFVCAVLWTVIARSGTPMRRKISMFFAVFLFVVSLASGGALALFL